MTMHAHGQPITLGQAREAKEQIRRNRGLLEHTNGIGISRVNGEYCIKVNLARALPGWVLATFPQVVAVGGQTIRVIYDVIGPVAASARGHGTAHFGG